MKAPYENGKMKDFPEKATKCIATAGKRCTDDFFYNERLHVRLASV